LLGFVSETTGLVGSRWTGGTVNDVQLSVFPATNSEKETKNIGLFVLVQLCRISLYSLKYKRKKSFENDCRI
jgi:hypothetical protein